MKKFIFIPLFIAFLALTIQIVDQLISPLMPIENNAGFGWIGFQAWAMYFLAGCNLKGAARTLIGYILSIVVSILIMSLGSELSTFGFCAIPLAIFPVVVGVIWLEKTNELTSFVPAIFVGAGVYFGMKSYVPEVTFTKAAIVEIIYCVIGLFYGYLTVTIRTWYEKKVNI